MEYLCQHPRLQHLTMQRACLADAAWTGSTKDDVKKMIKPTCYRRFPRSFRSLPSYIDLLYFLFSSRASWAASRWRASSSRYRPPTLATIGYLSFFINDVVALWSDSYLPLAAQEIDAPTSTSKLRLSKISTVDPIQLYCEQVISWKWYRDVLRVGEQWQHWGHLGHHQW